MGLEELSLLDRLLSHHLHVLLVTTLYAHLLLVTLLCVNVQTIIVYQA